MELSCEQCRRHLALLPVGVRPDAKVAAHLDSCAECRSWQKQDAAVWKALGMLAEPVPPPGLAERIAGAVCRIGREDRFGSWLRLAAAAVALAGALVGACLGKVFFTMSSLPEAESAPEVVLADVFGALPELALGFSAIEETIVRRLP